MSCPDHITHNLCSCSLCLQPVQPTPEQSGGSTPTRNSLHKFLEHFPRNFPLAVVSTAVPGVRAFYYNKFGNRLMTYTLGKMTQHFPLATNLALHYPQRIAIAHKYELVHEDALYLYIQAHSPKLPLTIRFCRDRPLDPLLQQRVPIIVADLKQDQYYNMSDSNREFMLWVHSEYKDEVFCEFVTWVYCAFVEATKGWTIARGVFDWLPEKRGLARLVNVRDMEADRNKKILTFQQEYEQKVMEKLNSDTPSIENRLLSSLVGNNRINYRVSSFRDSIRQIFESEKQKILSKTEKERTVDPKSLSDDIARLFLPELHRYGSLREVLNDEGKFRRVVLGEKAPKEVKDSKDLAKGETGRKKIRARTIMSKHNRCRTQL